MNVRTALKSQILVDGKYEILTGVLVVNRKEGGVS